MRHERGPLDTRVDRRLFLQRMGALTAAALTGSALDPAELRAREALLSVPGAGHPGSPLPGGVDHSPSPFSRGAFSNRTLLSRDSIQATAVEDLTLAEAATLVRLGELSPVELVEACLRRIEAVDGTLQAFNTVVAELAMDRARGLGRTQARSGFPEDTPLFGVPLAIKDNFYTAGILTTANSEIFAAFVPSFDAWAWKRLQDAGGIVLGKTQMGPLATTAATTPDGIRTTRNAWAPGLREVDPGGSSSGSATAVAARMAPCSTGTQTGGSITDPALKQGLTGLKPTLGRVSLRGIIPLTYTRDHPGPIARDARDAALMLQVMAGEDPGDPRTHGQPPVPDLVKAATPSWEGGGGSADRRVRLRWPTRIGVFPDYLEVGGEDDEPQEDPAAHRPSTQGESMEEARARRRVRAAEEVRARREMLDRFRDLGAEIVEVPYPRNWALLTGREFNNVRLPERSEAFLPYLQEDVRQFGVALSPWINGLLLSGTEYLRGQRAKLLLLERVLAEVFGRCDVVVQTDPVPFDMIGLPLIAFPIGFESASRGVDLPMGAMFGGMPWGEDRLLSLVGAYQGTTDWHRRRPPDPGPGKGAGQDRDGGSDRDRGSSGPRGSSRGPDAVGGPEGAHRIDCSEVMDLAQ